MTIGMEDFPNCAKCTGDDLVVFVACPEKCRFGDVRKTLAAILNTPFASINLGPHGSDTVLGTSYPSGIFPGDDLVPWEKSPKGSGEFVLAILKRDSEGGWAPT